MTIDGLVGWIFVGAWAATALAIVLGPGLRIVHEARGIGRRVGKIGERSLSLHVVKAQHDANRLVLALERLPELVERARTALERLRTVSFVPAGIRMTSARIRREYAAFRAALRP